MAKVNQQKIKQLRKAGYSDKQILSLFVKKPVDRVTKALLGGKDGVDGKDGENANPEDVVAIIKADKLFVDSLKGQDASAEDVANILLNSSSFISKVKGRDGLSVNAKEVIKQLLSNKKFVSAIKGKDGVDGKDGENVEMPDIESLIIDTVTKIKSFEGDDRLDASVVKNLEKNIDVTKTNIKDIKIDASQVTNLPEPVVNKITKGGSGVVGIEIIKDTGTVVRNGATEIDFGDNLTVTRTANGVKIDAPSGGSSAFTDLTDTPSSYTSEALKALRVNAGATALEFYTPTDANDALVWGNATGTLSDQTDLQSALDGKLSLDQSTPETVTGGAPDFSEGIDTQHVLFDTSYTSTGSEPEGSLFWNNTDETLDLVRNGTTLQLGQELYIRVRNVTGSTITNGQVVYASGHTGIFPEISLARGDAEITGETLGIATEDIASPAFGTITTFGYIRGLKTNYSGSGVWGTTWVEGDKLYVSDTTAGQLTNIEPSSPHHSDLVATVGVVHATQGTILVGINRHTRLEELSDVNGTTLDTNGQIVVWDNDNSYFDFTDNINNYALTTSLHDAVTVTDSAEIDFTLTGQDITASLIAGSIDETKLDTSVNASLDLADSSLQSSDIGSTVQAWDSQLDSLASIVPGAEGRYIRSDGLGGWEIATTSVVRADINVEDGATADQTDAEIKTAYENNANTNAYTDAEKTIVGNTSGVNTGDQDLSGYVETTDIDTLAELNAIITDATLIDTTDSRLSDARTPTAHTHPTSDIVSGTFDDARIAESNVTQHEAALSITESQITDLHSITITASENLAAGDVVNIHNSSGAKVRKADASNNYIVHGFVNSAVTSGNPAAVLYRGIITTTGRTIGAEQYLSDTAGLLVETAPSGSGNTVQMVGVAISTTQVLFNPYQPIKLV